MSIIEKISITLLLLSIFICQFRVAWEYKQEIEQLRAANSILQQTVEKHQKALDEAKAEIKAREARIKDVLEKYSEWADTELPFDFNSLW